MKADDACLDLNLLECTASAQHLGAFMQRVVYLRGGEDGGFVICAADGTPMAHFEDRQTAEMLARQHELELVQLH